MKNSLKGNKCSKEEAYLILKEFIDAQVALCNRNEISESSFDNPNWAFYQAYQSGMKKAFSKIIEFLPNQGE